MAQIQSPQALPTALKMIQSAVNRTRSMLQISLFNNATYLIALQFGVSASNMLFWLVVARWYPADQVGIATTVLAVATFLSGIASMGMPDGLVYYLPTSKEPTRLINTVYSVSGLGALVFGAIYLLGLNFWSPDLITLQQSLINIVLFVLGTVVLNITQAQDIHFIAERVSKLSFYKGIWGSLLKFPMLLPVFFVASWQVIFAAIIVSTLISVVLYTRKFQQTVRQDYKPRPLFASSVWRPIIRYSLGNLVADSISLVPNSVLPVLVFSQISPAASAYFFIAWTIAGTLSVVGRALGSALFAEGSHNQENLEKDTVRSMLYGALILIPGVIAVAFLGKPVLSLFGEAYGNNGAALTTLLAASAIPLTVYRILAGVLKGRSQISQLTVVTIIDVVLHIGLSVWLVSSMGLMGIGIAKLVSHMVAAVLAFGFAFPQKLGLARAAA